MPKKQNSDSSLAILDLLKKSLALQLFAVGVSQGNIAKKLRMNLNTVNAFLKGIKKANAKKTAKQSRS
jgi:hypothetical protein